MYHVVFFYRYISFYLLFWGSFVFIVLFPLVSSMCALLTECAIQIKLARMIELGSRNKEGKQVYSAWEGWVGFYSGVGVRSPEFSPQHSSTRPRTSTSIFTTNNVWTSQLVTLGIVCCLGDGQLRPQPPTCLISRRTGAKGPIQLAASLVPSWF